MALMKHPNDMTREELRELVGDMAGMALDLAQYLRFTTEALREDLRPAAYKKAIKMAYELAFYPYNGKRMERGNCEIVVFDDDGLTVHRGDLSEVLDAVARASEEEE